MNAIYDALGVRISALPAVPEKVLMAIRRQRAADKSARGDHRRISWEFCA
jgi:hypothetical protein